ncbi:MAG: 2-oxoacid:acceptor oxidoreductase family protein [Candidatus Thorarchaeota archaeon]|jgi:indolepyruvate ferredoxin oxidoreductase beta subunit
MTGIHNILVAGVGGQGNLVSGRILAEAARKQKLRPMIGQVFGASRRGGTVMIHVRFSETDVAPVIPKGQVDVLLGFEPMETLRAVVDYCGPKTTVIMSSVKIEVISSLTNKAVYSPVEDIVNAIASVCNQTYVLNPENALKEIGSYQVLNTYMIGALAQLASGPLDIDGIRTEIEQSLSSSLPNIPAFDAGISDAKETQPWKKTA